MNDLIKTNAIDHIALGAAAIPTDQDAAQLLTQSIRSDLARANESFLLAGAKLHAGKEGRIWEYLERKSWSEYCERDLGISDSEAYDLIRIFRLQAQFPALAQKIVDTGKSRMRLLLSQINKAPDGSFDLSDNDLEISLDHAQNADSWNSLRKEFSKPDPLDSPEHLRECPLCHATLFLDRDARIVKSTRVRVIKPKRRAK